MLLWLIILALLVAFFGRDFIRWRKPTIAPNGKVIFITGAASGIGRAVTKSLLNKGCFVYAADLNKDALEKEYGSETNVSIVPLDVTDQNQVDNAVKIVEKDGKLVYAVVGCAGIGCPPGCGETLSNIKLLSETSVEKQKIIMEVNFYGLVRLNNAFIHHLIQTKGIIVNIVSIAGKIAMPGHNWAWYCASKFAGNAYSTSLRAELSSLGVRVVCIEPGFVYTPLTSPLKSGVTAAVSKFPEAARKIANGKLMNDLTASTFMTPEFCAKDIVDCVFMTSPPSHLIIDNLPNRIKFALLSSVTPQWVLDWVFSLQK